MHRCFTTLPWNTSALETGFWWKAQSYLCVNRTILIVILAYHKQLHVYGLRHASCLELTDSKYDPESRRDLGPAGQGPLAPYRPWRTIWPSGLLHPCILFYNNVVFRIKRVNSNFIFRLETWLTDHYDWKSWNANDTFMQIQMQKQR